jgi:hypothetical protein
MILQLNPPLPVTTPKGPALAHAIIDDGLEHDLKWVCFLDMSGECWTFRNRFIRADRNVTQGRDYISPFYNPDDVAFKNKELICEACEEYIHNCECEEDEDDENENDEKDERLSLLEDYKIKAMSEIQEKSETIKLITKVVLDMQEILLKCMRKKNFEKVDFTNMFGCLVRSGMSESDIKTLTGMKFERF